jgi:hypothetical protein
LLLSLSTAVELKIRRRRWIKNEFVAIAKTTVEEFEERKKEKDERRDVPKVRVVALVESVGSRPVTTR